MGNKNLYIYALIGLAVGMGTVEVIASLQEQAVSDSTQIMWGLASVIMSVLWLNHDATNREGFEKPYDFGFLVYFFLFIAFPWYLYKTRGAEGLLVFLGFLAIWFGPWLSGLVAYVYFV